jgi:hypothetical protein
MLGRDWRNVSLLNPEAGLANQVQRKPQEEILHVHNGRGGCCSTGQDSSKLQGVVPEDKSAEFMQHSGGKLKAGHFAPLARELPVRVEDPISYTYDSIYSVSIAVGTEK